MSHTRKFASSGFTRIELAIVTVIVMVLGSMLLPALSKSKCRFPRIQCVNNLKQIGVAYRVWESDNNDLVPSTASFEQGGLSNLFANAKQGINCWRIYGLVATNLGFAPKILICPSDERVPATNFIVKWSPQDKGNADIQDNTHLSYFVGLGSSDTYPQSILGGDRNLAPGFTSSNDYGFSPANNRGNDVIFQTNSPSLLVLKNAFGGKCRRGRKLTFRRWQRPTMLQLAVPQRLAAQC